MEAQNTIAIQHAALKALLEDTYGLNIKGFLIDAAEIIESLTDNQQLIEALWECAAILPMMDHSNPK